MSSAVVNIALVIFATLLAFSRATNSTTSTATPTTTTTSTTTTTTPPHLCDLGKSPCNLAGSACIKLSAEATNYTCRCTPPYIGVDSATGERCGKVAIYTETPANGRRGSM